MIELVRASSSTLAEAAPLYQASSWLAALPAISASYLDSDERFGTDEAELILNLPIKSNMQRKSDKALAGLVEKLDEVGTLQRSLYFSGLIREAVWSYRIASVNGEFAGHKLQVLQRLEQRHKDLLQANATSEYALLLIQNELVTARLGQQEYEEEARGWLQQYKHVTGLGSMPASIEEPPLEAIEFAPDRHPRIRQLELVWMQKQQLLLAGSDQATPWNLSLHAKNLDTDGYEEEQYGIAVEIPLSFIKMASQSHNSEWREESRQYGMARDQLVSDLFKRWQMLTTKSGSLQKKQQLLARSSQLSEQIARQIEGLQAGNEIGEEIALRRMTDAIDARAAAVRNEILIHQNNAMLGQHLLATPFMRAEVYQVATSAVFQWQKSSYILVRAGERLTAVEVDPVGAIGTDYLVQTKASLQDKDILVSSVSAVQGILLGLGGE
jgi:hypothetical protein